MKKIVMAMAAVAALSLVTAQAGGDEVEREIEAELELDQDVTGVEVEVEAKGLVPFQNFTVRAYISTVKNCMRGMGNAHAAFGGSSNADGELDIEGTVSGIVVSDVGSVSIRRQGGPGTNPPVVCFQNTNGP